MNWDDLRIVLAIARTGSLTQAARVLEIDHTTAGRRLTRLEARLGTILFLRSKTGFRPTEAGEAAIAQARAVQRRVEALEDEVARAGRGPAGPLRICGNDWVLLRLADVASAAFLRRHPVIDLRLLSGAPRSIQPRDASLSLWFEVEPKAPEFRIPLGPVPYALYRSRSASRDDSGWVAYYDEDMPNLSQSRFIESARAGDSAGRVRFAASDMTMQMAAVRAGVGIGLLPKCLAGQDPGIEPLRDGATDLVRTLHLYAHPDAMQSARVQAAVEWLRDGFGTIFGAVP